MTDEQRTETVRAMMRRGVEKARERAAQARKQTRPVACDIAELAQAVTELSLAVEWLLDQTEPRQRIDIGGGKTVERAPNCCGCIFPHALCGPCHRWNWGGS